MSAGEAGATMSEAASVAGSDIMPRLTGAAEPAGSIYNRNFWLIFAATFALNSAANLFVLFPLYVVRLGGRASTIGAIVGFGSLAALLTRPLASAAVDRRGRRRTALWAIAIDASVITLYIPLHSLGWSIYAVRALHGAAEGTARVALFAMVYAILPSGRQGEAMATFSLSGMLPAAFGALLGEMILRWWGFPVFFCAATVLCIGAAITLKLLPEELSAWPIEPRTTDSAVVPDAISYRMLLFDPLLAPLWVVTLFFGLASSSRVSFVAPFAYQRGIHEVGWYFTIFALVAVAVRLSGRAMDRIGLERMLAPSLAVLALGLALLVGTGHFYLLEVAAAVAGLGHGVAYPALSALVVRNTRAGGIGRSSSIYTSAWDASSMIGPYLLGLTANQIGYGRMFLVAGGLSLVGAIYFQARQPSIGGDRFD